MEDNADLSYCTACKRCFKYPTKQYEVPVYKWLKEITISLRDLGLQKKTMMLYCKNKTDVVEYVEGMLRYIKTDLPLITIITPEKSEGYFVTTATGGLLEGIVALEAELNSLKPPTNTSQENTPDG